MLGLLNILGFPAENYLVDENTSKDMTHTYARLVLPGDTATRAPGESARLKAEELRPPTLHRWAARISGRKTADASWARGRRGEEKIGRLLYRLPSEWKVVHDLQ